MGERQPDVGAFAGLIGGGVSLFNTRKAVCWKRVEKKILRHDRRVFAKALSPDLKISEMDEDSRIQIYRTSMIRF